MDLETVDLISALKALQRQIPRVCLGLIGGTLSVDKQAEFGDLLVQLGQFIQHDAQQGVPPIVEGSIDHTGPLSISG